jgi:cytidine diphosphoramidate kinase
MVIWLIGKSGAGKTEIGKRLYDKLKLMIPNIVFLDGDELRNAISWDLGHSLEDRHTSEKRRSQLCKLLSEQDISVICAALSNAPDLREWNKKNIKNYYEAYIKVGQNILHERDSKGLYQKYNNKEIDNVVGEDISFHEPENPWVTINNDGENKPEQIVVQIMLAIKKDQILE